jgi:hypothetical protein
VVAGDDLARPDHGRGVVQTPVRAVHEPDQEGRPVVPPARDVREGLEVVGDERAAEQQVLRGIPGDRQLGIDDQVRAGAGGVLGGDQDPLDVAVEVADRRVDLCECDPHTDQG